MEEEISSYRVDYLAKSETWSISRVSLQIKLHRQGNAAMKLCVVTSAAGYLILLQRIKLLCDHRTENNFFTRAYLLECIKAIRIACL